MAASSERQLRMRVSEDSVVTLPLRGSSLWEVRVLVADEGDLAIEPLVRIRAQDHAWVRGSHIVHGLGHRVMAVGPLPTAADPQRELLEDLPVRIGALPDTTMVISRLAVSDDGTSIVLVVDRPQN